VLPEYALFKNKIQRATSTGRARQKLLPVIAVLDKAVSTVITTEIEILN